MHSKNCTCGSQNNVKHESYCAKLTHFNEFRNNKFNPTPKLKPTTFDSDYLLDSNEDEPLDACGLKNENVCCCKPDSPHDESTKFVLLGEAKYLDQPIYNSQDSDMYGRLTELNKYKHVNHLKVGRDHKKQLTGRNLII